MSGRAKLSGVETDLTYAALYTFREGKIVRGRGCLDTRGSPRSRRAVRIAALDEKRLFAFEWMTAVRRVILGGDVAGERRDHRV